MQQILKYVYSQQTKQLITSYSVTTLFSKNLYWRAYRACAIGYLTFVRPRPGARYKRANKAVFSQLSLFSSSLVQTRPFTLNSNVHVVSFLYNYYSSAA